MKFVKIILFLLVLVKSEATNEKRLILHDDVMMASLIQNMSVEIRMLNEKTSLQDKAIADLQSKLSQAKAKISQLETDRSQSAGHGSTYIRWGRTVCSGNGTELVYKGFAAGSAHNDHGSAADYICLAQDPTWGHYENGVQSHHGLVYGVEYEFAEQYSDGGAAFFGKNMHNHDVPCVVCHSGRPSVVMIPGRNQCYSGWTMEYQGYLVTGRDEDASSTNYVCLDSRPETEFGDSINDDGKLMVIAEVYCGSLKCDPYVQGRELACVVCSK